MKKCPPIGETADCPPWLDEKGKRRWWDLAPAVAELHGTFTPRLAHSLGRYIEAYQAYVAAGKARQKRGGVLAVARTTRKGWKFWPEVIAQRKASRTMLHLCRELGLAPVPRAKILARRKPHQPRGR